MELEFVREKETKNTIRFKEVEKEGQLKVIGYLYVMKQFAGDREKLVIEIKE